MGFSAKWTGKRVGDTEHAKVISDPKGAQFHKGTCPLNWQIIKFLRHLMCVRHCCGCVLRGPVLWRDDPPSRNFLFVIIEHFPAISYGWDVINGKLTKSAFFRRGSLSAQISEGRGRRPPTTVGIRNLEWSPSRAVSESAVHCLVLSESTRVTDR